MIKSILECASLIIAGLALVISYRVYLRQKTFENENHLFKYYLEQYHELLEFLASSVYTMAGKIDKLFYKKYDGTSAESISRIVEDIEDFELKLSTDIICMSAFFPDDVFFEVEKFTMMLNFGDQNLEKIRADKYEQVMEQIDKIHDVIFDIADAMREDLHIERLNEKLIDRLKEKNFIRRDKSSE